MNIGLKPGPLHIIVVGEPGCGRSSFSCRPEFKKDVVVGIDDKWEPSRAVRRLAAVLEQLPGNDHVPEFIL